MLSKGGLRDSRNGDSRNARLRDGFPIDQSLKERRTNWADPENLCGGPADLPEMLRKDESNQAIGNEEGGKKYPQAPGFMGGKAPASTQSDVSACGHAKAGRRATKDRIKHNYFASQLPVPDK